MLGIEVAAGDSDVNRFADHHIGILHRAGRAYENFRSFATRGEHQTTAQDLAGETWTAQPGIAGRHDAAKILVRQLSVRFKEAYRDVLPDMEVHTAAKNGDNAFAAWVIVIFKAFHSDQGVGEEIDTILAAIGQLRPTGEGVDTGVAGIRASAVIAFDTQILGEVVGRTGAEALGERRHLHSVGRRALIGDVSARV